MRIGELSAATGVSVRSLRYYEEQRLLMPERSSSGQRTYSPNAVQLIGLIQRLFNAGLCSKAIAELLPCINDPASRTPELRSRLLRERERLSHDISKIAGNRNSLDNLISSLEAK
ncbi:MerR family transcriptional regulator [Pseudarthrobacter sp. HLT3-5]|uniref:MerR family transcriptional regulator n=1 Tax=Pseudarthrobacter cellobiosi TaxID=2953654 RepID=UPI00208ECE13|nr:MerR family transcriptional regulator [Pseudarthrobacter sp. HLT3-5]MCO4275231.1 MerR family transcriptional regulator [Pseudarthrobacter sp. HLT3-5]